MTQESSFHQSRRIRSFRGVGQQLDRSDEIAVEEPLKILLGEDVYAVVMRTPGADLDLATGLLFAEGLIQSFAEMQSIVHCHEFERETRGNVVRAVLNSTPRVTKTTRNLIASSSCGVCGRTIIEDLSQRAPQVESNFTVACDVLFQLPFKLEKYQAGFQKTGGTHAAALFRGDGSLLDVREDVGRHNAVDKIVGAALRRGDVPLGDTGLFVSGRTSFEIVQKARMAGIPLIAAVSAPTTLAMDLAEEGNVGLAGFLRGDSVNLYAGLSRFAGV